MAANKTDGANHRTSATYDYLVTLAFNKRGTVADAIDTFSSLMRVVDKQVFGGEAGKYLHRVASVEQDSSGTIYVCMVVESPDRASGGRMGGQEFSELLRYAWQRLTCLDWADEDERDGAVEIVATKDCPERTANILKNTTRTDSTAIRWELLATPVSQSVLVMHPRVRESAANRSQEGGLFTRPLAD